MDEASDRSWSIILNVVLLIVATALYLDAGTASIRGPEVSAGFLPKIVATGLFLLSSLNLFLEWRTGAAKRVVPAGIGYIFLVLGIGFVGVFLFRQLGMLVALLFVSLAMISLFERRISVYLVLLSILVSFAVHAFFIGGLGIFDPAGRLVDLRWLTPW